MSELAYKTLSEDLLRYIAYFVQKPNDPKDPKDLKDLTELSRAERHSNLILKVQLAKLTDKILQGKITQNAKDIASLEKKLREYLRSLTSDYNSTSVLVIEEVLNNPKLVAFPLELMQKLSPSESSVGSIQTGGSGYSSWGKQDKFDSRSDDTSRNIVSQSSIQNRLFIEEHLGGVKKRTPNKILQDVFKLFQLRRVKKTLTQEKATRNQSLQQVRPRSRPRR